MKTLLKRLIHSPFDNVWVHYITHTWSKINTRMPAKKHVKSDYLETLVLVSTVIFLIGVLGYRLLKGLGFTFTKEGVSRKITGTSQPNPTLNIPIITYHYIEVVTDKRDFLRSNMAITPYELKRQILELKDQGYSFIFIKDIPKLLHMKTSPTGKYIALTFDDGYRDFYTDAYPVLRETGVRGTVFVISGFLNYQNYMTDDQLKEVAGSGIVEVGAHTISHLELTSIPPENADSEIVGSKDFLETKLGMKVESFSYPYGRFNENIIQMVKDAGYSSAVSDTSGTSQSLNNLYFLSRVRVGYFFKF